MIESAIAIVVLILVLFFFKIRKKKLSVVASTEPVKPTTPEYKPSVNIVDPSESVSPAKETFTQTTTVSESLATPVQQPAESDNKPAITPIQVTAKVAVSSSAAPAQNKNLPEDSMLRRHYLSHLHAMVSAINAPRPTDSTLRRHYDSQIAAKIEQYLNSETATEQLIQDYKAYQKTLTRPVVKETQTITVSSPLPESPVVVQEATPTPVVVKQASVSKIPEDSTLKRHYLTQLRAQVAAKLPARPTDATLRRHYDTLLENEINKQLSV